MTDTRTLKEMMRELEIQMTRMETKQEYELNHLRNIDHHLELEHNNREQRDGG